MRAAEALLLLDLQESICRPDGEIGRGPLADNVTARGVLSKAGLALGRARERGMLVAYSVLAFDEGYADLTSRAVRLGRIAEAGLGRGSSPGAAVCAEVAPTAGDLVVRKVGIDPLVGTPLLGYLRRHGVGRVAIGGVATEHVVESTARHAADLGFETVVLEDLCGSYSDELHRHSIERTLPFYATISTSDEFFAADSA